MPNVNIFHGSWTPTGQTVPVPQYTIWVRFEWTGNDGQPRTHEETVTFPNDLQKVPVSWLNEEFKDLLLRAARHYIGVD